MGQILVRKIDDDVLKRIKARAEAHGRSTEAEVREILNEAVASPKKARRSLSSFIGSVQSNRSQAEIDAYVRRLRDEWDN
ncbi:FitA-like ribbon-helix-helix domain-containing protein [Aestuariivirga sp. YIM B02566]|uniref:Arc family DNA-binding protein n=1 Tax=Taklimakanibacter albus TaxID=2800327 RepID=A0ACC5R2G9_9HYPH|nr:Arc family DNA-binding protein [Aestuariivirga sp. YIM B02566]MBK1866855.1 Arc family DNA-binding protein [Aestuariivirga sp. YIM B02566]